MPPVEGWDPQEQTKLLAGSAPCDHGLRGSPEYYGQGVMDSIMESYLYTPYKHKIPADDHYDSLEEFIRYADWERSGASSIGRVHWEYKDPDNKEWDSSGSFIARKNMMKDIYTSKELAEMCFAQDAYTDNVAIIKSELAKIRIAVSSPLEVYLLESWLLSRTRSYYLQWKGSTLEEKPYQEYRRNYDQWKRMVSGMFTLPLDYEKFDHQILTAEIIKMLLIGHRIAGTDVDRLLALASAIVIASTLRATLRDPPGHGDNKYPVTNGLMSGMRTTSIIGNGFNISMWGLVCLILVVIIHNLLSEGLITYEARGDDMRLTSLNKFLLALIYLVYVAIGARANPSKFSLCYRRGDFLRLDCTAEDGLVGLPARTGGYSSVARAKRNICRPRLVSAPVPPDHVT